MGILRSIVGLVVVIVVAFAGLVAVIYSFPDTALIVVWFAVFRVLPVLLLLLPLFLLRFTVVEEGTAKAVTAFGKFSGLIFQWDKHWMDENWEIVREEETEGHKLKERKPERWRRRLVGGLYLYGIWPIHRIHSYKHRWSDIRLRGNGKMELESHDKDEVFSHVLLKPAVYAIKLLEVETAPPERIPVTVLVLITLRIENPYLFLFVAPPTPIEDVLARIEASMRSVITSCQLDDLLRLKGESLWKVGTEGVKPLLAGAKVIVDTLKSWGMKLADKGIEVKEISLPVRYQEAGAIEQEQRMRSKGLAAQTMGAMTAMIAEATNQNLKEVQNEFQNPEEAFRKYDRLIKANMDFIQRKMGLDADAVRQYYFQGGGGGADLIALAGDVFRGSSGGKSSGSAKKGQVQQGDQGGSFGENYTQEELERALKEKEAKKS